MKSNAMKIISKIVIAMLLLCGVAYGQDVYESDEQDVYDSFYEALQNEDLPQMVTLIWQIKSSGDKDPERYIAEFNYFFYISDKSEGPVHLSTELPDDEEVTSSFELRDSTGNVSGYIYGVSRYDPALSDSGIAIISQGIELYPYRLDMRMGKIYALGKYKRWDAFAKEIMDMLDYTEAYHDSWEYPDEDEPIDNIIMEGVLDYEKVLLEQYELKKKSETEAAVILGYTRDIATRMIEIYPGKIYFVNIMAVTYNEEGDYGNALKWLKKAEAINPNDVIVLLNMADTYYNMGDRAMDRKYLKKLLKSDDQDARDYAKRMLKSRK